MANRPLFQIVAALAVSVMLYVILFAFVFKQPLTTGLTERYYERKLAYAKSLPSPKLVLFAGSNGLFSFRCETIARKTGLPCVNASLHAGLALDVVLHNLKAFLKRGDIVLMPLEYDQYMQTDREMIRSGATNNYAVSYHPEWLRMFSAERLVRALFSFNLEYALSSVTESALSLGGVRRRYNEDTITVNGDMKGHTREKGEEYRAYIKGLGSPVPDGALFAGRTFAGERVLSNFLRWAKSEDITVVGMLPTVFDDKPIPAAVISRVRGLYEGDGQLFLDLPGHSQYPRPCFYDTQYHLNEECQIENSREVARCLDPLLNERMMRQPGISASLLMQR